MAAGTAALYLAPPWIDMPPQAFASTTRSRVVRTTRSRLIDSSEKIDPNGVRFAIDETLIALTDTSSARQAWEHLFPGLQTTDVIGIKVNMRNNQGLVSHPEVVYTLARSLTESLEFNPNNVIIWDKNDEELARNGYTINRSDKDVRCFGTRVHRARRGGGASDPADVGYDMRVPVDVGASNPVHFTKILTELCTYLINVPVLKDHRIAGVTLSMKNHYGTIDNPGSCHGNAGDPYIAHLNNTSLIKDKTKLLLCDALFGCYDGGPSAPAQWIAGQLLASTDPVAFDYVGLTMIDQQRRDRNMTPVAEKARFLHTAARLGLGNKDPQQIDLIEAG